MENPPKKSLTGLGLFRIALWVMVAVVGLGAAGFYFWHPPGAGVVGLTGAPFTLNATTGGEFTQASFKGTPTLLFFGYTFCPDVCPTTLAEMTAAREQLKLSPTDVRIVFATVDPARDTIKQMTDYLTGFGSPILGLTGTEEQVKQAEAAFGIYAKKGPDDGTGTYLMDHTATVFMLGRDGEFEGTIAPDESPKTAAEKIKRLVGA